jgi:hypothetical protein
MRMKSVIAAVLLVACIPVEMDAAVGCFPSKTLTCGSVVTASLSATGGCILNTFPTAVYAFNGTAGQTIAFHASNSSGFDIGLVLSDSSGKTISSAFDEPADVTAELTATGQYTVSVNFGNPHQSGSFTLTTSCVTTSPPPPTQCLYTSTGAIGSTISGQLAAADAVCGGSSSYAKVYRLPVNAGDTFEVDYSTVGYQPYVSIVGPDTSSGRRWAEYPVTTVSTYYVAPTTGNVSIYAMSNNTTPTTGSFTMKILPLSQPGCGGKSRAVRH